MDRVYSKNGGGGGARWGTKYLTMVVAVIAILWCSGYLLSCSTCMEKKIELWQMFHNFNGFYMLLTVLLHF